MKKIDNHHEPVIHPHLYSPIENKVVDNFKIEMGKMLVDVTKILVESKKINK